MNIEWIDVQKWRRKKLEKLIEYLIIKTKQERWACVSSGVNFINVLWAAFAPVDPKSVKRYWQLDWTLTLLGATGVKAVRKYVGEIEPRCQFHQCSMSSFCTSRSPKRKKILTTWLNSFAFGSYGRKSCT